MDFEEYAKKLFASCMSEWEGCLCNLPKQHEGLHRCVARECGCTWTTQQADEWNVRLRREIKEFYNGSFS